MRICVGFVWGREATDESYSHVTAVGRSELKYIYI